jgi:Rv0078B-related antitoxin
MSKTLSAEYFGLTGLTGKVPSPGRVWPYAAIAVLICSTRRGSSLTVRSGDNVNPECAFQKQIERYRRMTGEQRLAIALALHEFSCNVAREGIRNQNPTADDREVERLLHKRLALARQ